MFTRPPPPAATYDLTDAPAPPRPTIRPRPLATPDELDPAWKRRLYHLLALSVAVAYFLFLHALWAPAPGRPGIDENAYLVSAKLLAQHGTTALHVPHPLSYVGAMWLRTPDGAYFPKYPAGLPLLNAVLLLLGGQSGRNWAFLLSPACTAIAVYAMFRLTRPIAGSFLAILAMILLATTQTTLQLAGQPNSHAPALCFATCGMAALFHYARTGATRTGLLAGFLLGYAVGIRYSQGLMVLPLLAAVAMTLQPRRLRSWLTASLPLLAWAVPVGSLALFNWLTMGHLTGYDATKESTGFTWAEFLRKWEFSTHELYLYGLFMVAPLGLVGLVMMFRRNWRVALLLTLWFLPGALLYNAYYWGQQAPGIGFLRFYLDLYPPMIVAALWLIRAAARGASVERPDRGSVAVPLSAGLFTAITASLGLLLSLPEMTRQHVGNLNLAYSGARFLARVPAARAGSNVRPVVFCDAGMFPQFLMYAQFLGDCDWYSSDAFIPRFGGGFGLLGFKKADKDDSPVLIQPARRDFMENYYKGKSAKDLAREQNAVMSDALAAGRPVYALLTTGQLDDFRSAFVTSDFQSAELEHWTEPAGDPVTPTNRPLAPPTWRMNLIINWSPQTLHLLQITRKGAATQPATAPSAPVASARSQIR